MSPLKEAFNKLTTGDSLGGEESQPQIPKEVEKPPSSPNPPRFLIIGAGSRGRAYAECIVKASNGVVSAVAEPIAYKRDSLGQKYIWGEAEQPSKGQTFANWKEFVDYETERRRRADAGDDNVPPGVDGVFVCVLDEMHRDVVVGLAPLSLHVMCEKPLACSFTDCLDMYRALRPTQDSRVFSIGHVLRYSPHNRVLRRLLVEEKIIGEIASVMHTEPVGWRHFTHSYVRGNWRNSQTTGPSLLTKSCHDIDLLMWLLSYPAKAGENGVEGATHEPSTISSTGGLQFFKRNRKPAAAGNATNCTSCPLGDEGCKYSAKHIYLGNHPKGLGGGNLDWPIDVVVPDIEDGYGTHAAREAAILSKLSEDYDGSTATQSEVQSRNWFGRCVFESDNNVCDEQLVTVAWPEEERSDGTLLRPAKRAVFHMVAQTTKVCERFSIFYGEHGEVHADSDRIVVQEFATGQTRVYSPGVEDSGHGGGDLGLTRQFVLAVDDVKNHGRPAREAQCDRIGCTLEDALKSHAVVFAAEEARAEGKVIDWRSWWAAAVEKEL